MAAVLFGTHVSIGGSHNKTPQHLERLTPSVFSVLLCATACCHNCACRVTHQQCTGRNICNAKGIHLFKVLNPSVYISLPHALGCAISGLACCILHSMMHGWACFAVRQPAID